MWAKGIGSFQSFVYNDVNAKTLYIDGAISESRSSDTFAQHTLTSEWKRYYVVFRTFTNEALTSAGKTLTGKNVVPVRIFKGDNEVWIAGVKLEKGENHATQWSPTQDEMVGEDAYSVMLTNESHVFEGDTDRAVMASVECGVKASSTGHLRHGKRYAVGNGSGYGQQRQHVGENIHRGKPDAYHEARNIENTGDGRRPCV